MAATIDQLAKELTGLVVAVPAFKKNCFTIFSIDDMEQQARQLQNPPLAGVGYDGAKPVSAEGTAASKSSSTVSAVEMQFLIVIAVQYQYAGQTDTKPQATDLLDQIRGKVLGYMGANNRPWRFIAEGPEPAASVDGLVFYSQVWRTTVVVKGSFNNQ